MDWRNPVLVAGVASLSAAARGNGNSILEWTSLGRWPTQAALWLEWGSATAGQSLLPGRVETFESPRPEASLRPGTPPPVESLGHELEDVIADFRKLTDKELSGINAGLKKKKLEAISVLTEADWEKQHEEPSAKSAGAGIREMD